MGGMKMHESFKLSTAAKDVDPDSFKKIPDFFKGREFFFHKIYASIITLKLPRFLVTRQAVVLPERSNSRSTSVCPIRRLCSDR
jgi:hypothetical protein